MADNIVKAGMAICLVLILLGCYIFLPTTPQEHSTSVPLVYSQVHQKGINASG